MPSAAGGIGRLRPKPHEPLLPRGTTRPTQGHDWQLLGLRLRRLRLEQGYSLRDVAQALGYRTPNSILFKEQGAERVNARSLLQFARLYGVDLDWLTQDLDAPVHPIPERRDGSDRDSARTSVDELMELEAEWADLVARIAEKRAAEGRLVPRMPDSGEGGVC